MKIKRKIKLKGKEIKKEWNQKEWNWIEIKTECNCRGKKINTEPVFPEKMNWIPKVGS